MRSAFLARDALVAARVPARTFFNLAVNELNELNELAAISVPAITVLGGVAAGVYFATKKLVRVEEAVERLRAELLSKVEVDVGALRGKMEGDVGMLREKMEGDVGVLRV